MPRSKKPMQLPSQRTLAHLRALKWRQCPERKLHQEREVADFLRDLGLCLTSPVRGLPLPSWVGAVEGRARPRSVAARVNHRDPRATLLRGALDRLVQQRVVFETNCLWRASVLVSRELFPSLYAIVGDLDPEEDYLEQQRRGELGAFAVAVYEVILREGPVVKADLEASLRLSTSREMDSLAKVLQQLARTIKIVRASYTPERGAAWDAFFRWAPEVIRDARGLTRLEAAMKTLAAFVNESIVVPRVTVRRLFNGFLTPEVCNRALDLLVESGQLLESRRKLAGSAFLSR